MVSKAEMIVLKTYMMPELKILAINSDIITNSPGAADSIIVDFWE